MKYKLALVMSVLCAFSAWTEAKVKLPADHPVRRLTTGEKPVTPPNAKLLGNLKK